MNIDSVPSYLSQSLNPIVVCFIMKEWGGGRAERCRKDAGRSDVNVGQHKRPGAKRVLWRIKRIDSLRKTHHQQITLSSTRNRVKRLFRSIK